MKLVLASLVVLGLAASTVAQETAEGDRNQLQPPSEGNRVVTGGLGAQNVGPIVADIQEHRERELSYVRRAYEVVPFEIPEDIDVEADVVMWVGDHAVTRNEFRRRALMYAAVHAVEQHIKRVVTLEEMDRRIALGVPASKFEVDEAFIDEKLDEQLSLVEISVEQQIQQNPDLEAKREQVLAESEAAYLESIETSIGMETYRKLIGVDALFEKVFWPYRPDGDVTEVEADLTPENGESVERPEWFPQPTWDALATDMNTRSLRLFLYNSVISGEDVPAFFKTNIITRILDGLLAGTHVRFFFDEELPADAICRIGERIVKIDEIWPEAEAQIADTDVRLILRETAKLQLMHDELVKADKDYSDEEFAAAFELHDAEYRNTLFPLKNIVMFRGYDSLNRYREHFRYRNAWVDWRKETLDNDEVMVHFQTGGRQFFERGSVVLDTALDKLVPRPFCDASFEAAEDEMLEFFAGEAEGDFAGVVANWALPPVPTSQGDGRTFQRSPLRMRLTESELSIFLTGYSFADDIFYHGIPGEVFGPWAQECRRHAWGAESNAGVWMARVDQFTRRQVLGAFDGREYRLAVEDYLDLNYFDWSEDLLEAALPSVRFATGS